MFVEDLTLAPFRALATKVASTVKLCSERTMNKVNHFSLNRLEDLSLFLKVHHIFGGDLRIQVSRASTARTFPMTATLPSFTSISSKPVHGAGIKFPLCEDWNIRID